MASRRKSEATGHVVLLRAANVGGHNVFRPAALAKALAHLDVVNIGAAGTFLVRAKATPKAIRRELLSRLSFEPQMVVCPVADVVALVASDPFAGVALSKDVRGWVAAFDGAAKARPELPLAKPAGKAWCVRFDRVEGAFALGLWHRRPGGFLFPSSVVESALGVPVTTRWWDTVVRVAAISQRAT